MCGICGVVRGSLGADQLQATIDRMVQTLLHRGPDGRNTRSFLPPVISRPVALGHTRLAIIDVSEAGRQPMSNEDGTAWLIFNGEIYNFPELRTRLEVQGHRFRSHTDSEVILHLYDELGPDCVRNLDGIFAFAILDLKRDLVLLARDPLGVKPLYYSASADHFLFGSEIKAILASSMYRADVDWQAAHDYFTYLYVPGPRTMFQGILQLPPAHRLILNLADSSLHLERYWEVRRREEIEKASFADLKTQVRERLAASVKSQLISDVPLGVFLSGGIDSTIVTGLAREGKPKLSTFTVVFEGKEFEFYNEREKSLAVSRHLGTQHHELQVLKTDPAEVLDLVEYMDQPFGNPTSYLMYLLSRVSREHITVALCGAGGDELYAGYPRYRAVRLARQLGWVPRTCLRWGRRALDLVRDSYRTMSLKRARKFLDGLDEDFFGQYAKWTYFLDEEKKAQLLRQLSGSGACGNHRASSVEVLRAAMGRSRLADPDNRILHMDLQTFLVDNVLEYTDKMSMAVALEVRVPLLDPGFVELSLNIPFEYKVRHGETKALLQEAFAEFFPRAARHAPKRGFNAPLAHWILSVFDEYFEASQRPVHSLKDRMGEDIGATWKGGLLDWSFIQQMREQHRQGKRDNSYELFAVILFDVWWRKYITGTLPMVRWQAAGIERCAF